MFGANKFNSFLKHPGYNLETIGAVVGIGSGLSSIFGDDDDNGQPAGTVAAGTIYDPFGLPNRQKSSARLMQMMGMGSGTGTTGGSGAVAGSSSGGTGDWQTPNWGNLAPPQGGYLGGSTGQVVTDANGNQFFSMFTGQFDANGNNITNYIPLSGGLANASSGGAGTGGSGTGADFMSSDPSYQWRLSQGLESVNRGAAASGMLGSGNRLVDLMDYGQGLASTEFSNEFSRLAAMAGVGSWSGSNAGALGAQNDQAGWQGIAQGVGALSNSSFGSPTGALPQYSSGGWFNNTGYGTGVGGSGYSAGSMGSEQANMLTSQWSW